MPIVRTTSSNGQEFEEAGLNWHDLSKTYQNAVQIARNLHLRYLWINSLCIFQDSSKDWQQEAELMSKVYRYCFVNIAATGAENGQKGCFWNRSPNFISPTHLSIEWRIHEKKEYSQYVVVPEPNIWARKLTDEPLNTRAWVLQERILSPRILHFGRNQLF